MHTLLIMLITCTLSLMDMTFLRDVRFVCQFVHCRVLTGNVADPHHRLYTNEVRISFCLIVFGQQWLQ